MMSLASAFRLSASCYRSFDSVRLTPHFAQDDRGGSQTTRQTRSLLLFHIHVLSIDDAFVLLLLSAGFPVSSRSGAALRRRSLRACRLVHRLGQLVRSLRQVLAGLVHRGGIGALQRLLGVGE